MLVMFAPDLCQRLNRQFPPTVRIPCIREHSEHKKSLREKQSGDANGFSKYFFLGCLRRCSANRLWVGSVAQPPSRCLFGRTRAGCSGDAEGPSVQESADSAPVTIHLARCNQSEAHRDCRLSSASRNVSRGELGRPLTCANGSALERWKQLRRRCGLRRFGRG